MIKDPILVSVIMITYGHEKYIEKAIKGVLLQLCDFNIELIIADDHSPDNTKDIVNNILSNYNGNKIIKYTRHNDNKGSDANFLWAASQCSGEYIAICEGDDYWTDQNKLKKQVEFLEKNIDYGLVHTNCHFLKNDKLSFNLNKKIPVGYVKEHLMQKNFISNLTVCARKSVFMKSLSIAQKLAINGDLANWTVLSNLCKIGYIKDSTAVYRFVENSESNSLDHLKKFNFVKSAFLTKFILIKKFNYNARTIKLVNKRYIKILFKHSLILEDNEVINEFLFHCKNNNNFTGIIYRFFYKLSRFTLIKNTLLKIVKN